jgi:hypothetical protein
MYTVFVVVLLPAALVTLKLTLYFPAIVYLCTGFFWVEYVLSPKLHFHDVGAPVLLSAKATFKGDLPEVTLLAKFAIGF